MSYVPVTLKTDLHIESVFSIHYFEYMSDFSFEGESHDFWEFCCVDKGIVNVIAGDTLHTLTKGQIIFHKPNEFHNLKANGKVAPNIVVMSYRCNSPCMKFFENRIINMTETERNLIAQIIMEARRCFSSKLDDPYLLELKKREYIPFGCEQLILLYLEQMLLDIVRRHDYKQSLPPMVPYTPPVKSIKRTNDMQIYERIISYMETHILEHLTIENVCHANLIGRSQLQKLFRTYNDCGVIYYFSKMKIDMAKQLIREQHMNFTQISDYLGYTSVHYFSRQFKKITGMTPTEYASSIKVLSEGSF